MICALCVTLRLAWYAVSTHYPADPDGNAPSREQLAVIERERDTEAYQTALDALREHLASHRKGE